MATLALRVSIAANNQPPPDVKNARQPTAADTRETAIEVDIDADTPTGATGPLVPRSVTKALTGPDASRRFDALCEQLWDQLLRGINSGDQEDQQEMVEVMQDRAARGSGRV